MKRLLLVAAVAGMAVWTALGILAWSRLARDEAAPREGDRDALAVAALEDELAALHADVRALAEGVQTSLEALHDELAARVDENASALRGDLAALRGEVASRPSPSASDGSGRLDAGAEPVEAGAGQAQDAGPPLASDASEAPATEAPGVAVAPAPDTPRRGSFLAFQLPSDDFRFDERRKWTVLPALSRVGFDAKSTLHDFSGTTSAVAGELECDLARPDEKPRARVVAEAARLDTGEPKRDAEMRECLAVGEHRTLEFALTAFESRTVDAAALRVTGTARGTMTIRGVTREVSMPVTLAVDAARRLSVEGETTLDLETFGVPVPSKLGLITMEKDVKVWLSLQLRAKSRSEG